MFRHLCGRCGAVIDRPESATSTHGACPECGLGFVRSPLVAVRRRGPKRWLARVQRRRVAGREADRSRALRDRTFPLYGLDSRWQGRRWVGGHGWSGNVVTRIDLAHGDAWDPGAPLVRVATIADAAAPGAWHFAGTGLAQTLFHETGVHSDELRAPFRLPDANSWWSGATLTVDGQSIACREFRAADHWIALGEHGTVLLAVSARRIRFGEIALVTVDDLAPYLGDDGAPRSTSPPAPDPRDTGRAD